MFTFILQVSVGDEGNGGAVGGWGGGGARERRNNVFIMSLMCRRTLLFSISEHQPLLPADSAGRRNRKGRVVMVVGGWVGGSRTQITSKTDRT